MTVYCTQCGAAVDESARFCPNCGSAMVSIPAQAPTEAAAPAPLAPPAAPVPVAPLAVPAPAEQYGGFWIRFLAVVIDAVILTIIIAPIYAVVFVGVLGAGYAVGMPMGGRHLVMWMAARGLFFIAGWLYEALMWSSSRQATLGKMLLHLRVTDLEGRPITFARATGRHFAKYLSAFVFFVGYIIAAFTHRHQALHDMLAGTVVRRD